MYLVMLALLGMYYTGCLKIKSGTFSKWLDNFKHKTIVKLALSKVKLSKHTYTLQQLEGI